MQPKVRVFELAKELSVDSKRVLDVLQTLNVDVKNHMSTIDQKTADQVTEAVKRTPARKAETGSADSARASRAAASPKPTREANPAKTSLLEDFFGAGARPRQGPEAIKKEMRSAAAERRAPAERPPVAGRPRAAAERPAAERPAAERPAAERPAAERPAAERPAAERPAVETPTTEPSPSIRRTAVRRVRPLPAEAPESAAPVENTPEPSIQDDSVHSAEPPAAAADAKSERTVRTAPRITNEEAPDRTAASEEFDGQSHADAASDGPGRAVPSGPAAGPTRLFAGPRPIGTGPARPSGGSGIGLPSRPSAAAPPADRTGIEGGPRPPQPRGLSGIGLPQKPGTGGGMDRGPRPGGMGMDRGPRPGGAGFGPRPAGPGGPRPGGGFGRGRPGAGGLNIPKVDPKVAEQSKPVDGKTRIGQGGDRKKGDAFTKRETQASRPSEDKLLRRGRYGRQASVVERRTLRPITIESAMTVKDLAHEMGVTAAEVIKKLLTGFGIMATINQELDTDTCVLVGGEFGVEVTVKEVENVLEAYEIVDDKEEADELKRPRHPVVTIMGHVDHGKTSLLDAVRSAKVAAGEAGGITQHIGAYEVELNGKKITFLDTPGHEAFTAMRARGANVTDIAILVVAADDSVMPQTIESINHAKAAGVPILVAINKIDKEGANPERVKQDLTAHGLVTEEWGGETIMVPVSAKNDINLDLLLENILILAELQELKANPDKEARGTILEAQLDKNRGPLATVLVQAGTLSNGDSFVAGSAWGRVRAMFDHRGRKLKVAGPSTPVQILGFQSVPAAGDVFRVSPDERTARGVAEKRQAQAQAERQGTKAMSLDDFMSKVAEGEVKDLNLVIKGDVQGSVEALRGQLEKLRNDEVQVKIIHSAVGAVTETDVMLAATSKAIIIGFNVRPDDRAARAGAEQGIDIRLYNVIYNVVDDMKAALTGMLAPKIEEAVLGRAEVRETFKVPKVGMAAGCRVLSGKVTRNAHYRLIRDGIVVWNGEINALRRFKDEVKEVAEGYECGITLEKYQDFKPGDLLEAYEMKEVKAV